MSQEPRVTYYVIMPATKESDVSGLRPVSRLLQEEEADAKKRFENPTFQVLRRYAKKGNAESFATQLTALGIDAFVVSDTQIAGHLFLWAETANQGAGGMAFRDFSGQPLYCPFEDILAVCVGPARRVDGSETLLVDLHRRSTPITPRIDTAFFDFAAITGEAGADAYGFLEKLRQKIGTIEIDLQFNDVAQHLVPALRKGLATLPGEFGPPEDKMPSPYDGKSVKLFGVYSFLAREFEIQKAAS
ncbi:MAG: hypothetical protein PWP23_2758 [Candidatus Sumerlaeota bacterium]|nr:hypothetical protein [Candidatus Sumerlaeota bacterium]